MLFRSKRLPSIVKGLEHALSQFDEHGLKLHPDTVAQLRGNRQRSKLLGPAVILIGIAAAVLSLAAF